MLRRDTHAIPPELVYRSILFQGNGSFIKRNTQATKLIDCFVYSESATFVVELKWIRLRRPIFAPLFRKKRTLFTVTDWKSIFLIEKKKKRKTILTTDEWERRFRGHRRNVHNLPTLCDWWVDRQCPGHTKNYCRASPWPKVKYFNNDSSRWMQHLATVNELGDSISKVPGNEPFHCRCVRCPFEVRSFSESITVPQKKWFIAILHKSFFSIASPSASFQRAKRRISQNVTKSLCSSDDHCRV